MKLRQLQCLCAVVDAGFNISKAATELHATQPAVSKQLRQLEEELGLDLLVRRRTRPVALTEPGERSVAWARQALQCAENIRAVARDGRDEKGGTISLATSHAHANYLMLGAVVAFRSQFSQIHINVAQGTPDEVAQLVAASKAAVGVTHMPANLPGEILAVPFLSSPRVLVVPSRHPLLRVKTLTLESLSVYPLVLPFSSRPQARILGRFQEAGLKVQVALQALNPDVIKTYVAAGLGVGIIPAFAFRGRLERGLRTLNAAHLFDPAVSAVLLQRHSHVQRHVYGFLAALHPILERRRIESLIFDPS